MSSPLGLLPGCSSGCQAAPQALRLPGCSSGCQDPPLHNTRDPAIILCARARDDDRHPASAPDLQARREPLHLRRPQPHSSLTYKNISHNTALKRGGSSSGTARLAHPPPRRPVRARQRKGQRQARHSLRAAAAAALGPLRLPLQGRPGRRRQHRLLLRRFRHGRRRDCRRALLPVLVLRRLALERQLLRDAGLQRPLLLLRHQRLREPATTMSRHVRVMRSTRRAGKTAQP